MAERSLNLTLVMVGYFLTYKCMRRVYHAKFWYSMTGGLEAGYLSPLLTGGADAWPIVTHH